MPVGTHNDALLGNAKFTPPCQSPGYADRILFWTEVRGREHALQPKARLWWRGRFATSPKRGTKNTPAKKVNTTVDKSGLDAAVTQQVQDATDIHDAIPKTNRGFGATTV